MTSRDNAGAIACSQMKNPDWTVLPTPEKVARVASERITLFEKKAIEHHGRFRIVLAGGSTPLRVYQLLSQQDHDWQNWQVYYGDERCLPVDHSERNSTMAARALLDRVAIPREQVHPIPAELGAETAAGQYSQLIDGALPFDLVLLGLGEDGHTASLFPGHVHSSGQLVVPVSDAPKPPPERVSLTAEALSQTQNLLFLVTGSNKQEAIKRWFLGGDLPAAEVGWLQQGEVLVDQAAWYE